MALSQVDTGVIVSLVLVMTKSGQQNRGEQGRFPVVKHFLGHRFWEGLLDLCPVGI